MHFDDFFAEIESHTEPDWCRAPAVKFFKHHFCFFLTKVLTIIMKLEDDHIALLFSEYGDLRVVYWSKFYRVL